MHLLDSRIDLVPENAQDKEEKKEREREDHECMWSYNVDLNIGQVTITSKTHKISVSLY